MTLRDEARKLAAVDQQLQHISTEHQNEINIQRKLLEACDKDLVYLERDARRKKEYYDAAKALLDARRAEKDAVKTKLCDLILESEKLKERKLNELMRDLNRKGSEWDSIENGTKNEKAPT